jgi:RHH-type proline utilization regulon transcriptional repressor/proline dehydrogenase/delta 1-pyrroline-5-carboxylate dehydrogenase
MAKLGARSVVAATLRAVQLLGRQFVLGQTIGEAMDEAAAARQRKIQPALQLRHAGRGRAHRCRCAALPGQLPGRYPIHSRSRQPGGL